MLLKSKQIDHLTDSRISISGFTTSAATSDTVTAEITTSLATASRDGGSVPLQVGSTTQDGVVTSGTNKVEIWDNTTGLKLSDLSGNEVYGRVTEAAGVYTLSYYTNVAGTETAHTFDGSDITFAYTYRFKFEDVPFDAGVRVNNVSVDNDGGGGSGTRKIEPLTITGTNTTNDLASTPAGAITIHINGQTINEGQGFTRVAKAITWVPATLGYDLLTTDIAVAEYFSFE